MSNYFPTPAYFDRMPIDISFVFEKDCPAGNHGFLKCDGENFRFEDGSLGKFWGVIFNGAACFPTHEYADKVANRLAMAGVNMVRFHQMDGEWHRPNIYQPYAGPLLTSTRKFSEESMERLDYLISALKKRGIYISVDMKTFRKYKSGDGVKFADLMEDTARGYSMYDPVMIELQKEACTNFWNHFNPYTGLLYKDDPVFATCNIVNENDLFTDYSGRIRYHRIPYYDDMFRDLFAQWLKEEGITDYDPYNCPLYSKDEPMVTFRRVLTERFYLTMRQHLLDLGVKIPISGTNWLKSDAMVQASAINDFTDHHYYFYDWSWGEFEKTTFHRSITSLPCQMTGMARSKLANKPSFMTEWDIPWPNSYRAEGAPYFAALACLQNISGMTIHTYSYGTFTDRIDRIGKESCSPTLGGVPYREGVFSCWNDPAKFGLFYHSSLMMRRGDVSPAKKMVGLTVDHPASRYIEKYQPMIERHRVCSVVGDTTGVDEVHEDTWTYPEENPNIIVSDTGELYRDVKKRIGIIDSPRTKIAYGFLGKTGPVQMKRGDLNINLNNMGIDCYTDFAVVALSSLNDDPIEKSNHMLLSTIGRARNTGAQFDGEKLIDFGHAPIVSEVIDAKIRIRTDHQDLRVWAINNDGYYQGWVQSTWNDGWLEFHVGPQYPSNYYLIQAE